RSGHIANRSSQRPLPKEPAMPPGARWLGYVAPISSRRGNLRRGGPGWVRVLASAQYLQPARGPKDNVAANLTPDTSGKLLRDRDLFSDLRGAVTAAQYPIVI